MDLKTQLSRLPAKWAYVAVDGNKRPYMKDWQKKPLTRGQLFLEIKSGRAKAVGVCAGPLSGGLLFLDHDGTSATSILTDWNLPIGSLPPSWMVTSGRIGRYQMIFSVPQEYWEKISTRKFPTGIKGKDGAVEQIELRWDGCQSIVAGAHPSTDGYSWMEGRSPDDLPLAQAPQALIEKMLPVKKAKPVKVEVLNSDYDRAIGYLQSLSPSRADDYDMWFKVGMSLHSVGDDRLLSAWEDWSIQSSKYEPGACTDKWESFGKRSGITLGTLHEYAKQDGWIPPRKQLPVSLTPSQNDVVTPIPSKLEPLTSQELVELLRHQQDEIRFNIFTHNIEINKTPVKGSDLFYLQLAEMGFKVPKELSLDCLVKVAHENEFDPVKKYLERVYDTVPPTYIEQLSTTYLRPSDEKLGRTTLYDSMLKATLINAVRRVYEPGCKHDTATVLMGPQGVRKSAFWKTLFGEFFSDALGDISSKDDLMCLQRSWGMEWAELDHITNRRHAGQIKSFLSRSTDMFRVPYGKTTEEFPRRGIIVGSTNKDSGFLVDETGNRRFWVIPVEPTIDEPINTETLEIERDAIWAAAVKAYKNHEPHFLTTEQENAVANENASYLVDSPWQSVIALYLASPANKLKAITTELLLTEAIEKAVDKQTKADQMHVSTVLKSLGYYRTRRSIDGHQKYIWLPTSEKR